MISSDNSGHLHSDVVMAKRRVRAAASSNRRLRHAGGQGPVPSHPVVRTIVNHPGASLAVLFAITAATSPFFILRCVGLGARIASAARVLSLISGSAGSRRT